MEIITTESIVINGNYANQQAVFEDIAKIALAQEIAVNQEEVVNSLIAREKESTTGMMDGFAIPHAKSASIKRPGIIILSLTNGIEWHSLDGQPIDFVVSLLIPEQEAGTTHLTLLSKVARLLMKEDVKQALKTATSASAIYDIITLQLGA